MNENPYSEDEVEVGRDVMSGLYVTPSDAWGDRGIVHRMKVWRDRLGRFVKRRGN